MKTRLRIELVEGKALGRRQWRVVLKRSGRVLLWTEHYSRKTSALKMMRQVMAAIRDGWFLVVPEKYAAALTGGDYARGTPGHE